jgi:hypothetical protein
VSDRKATDERNAARRKMIRTAEAFILADYAKGRANDTLPLADPGRAKAQKEADERQRDAADAANALRRIVVAEDAE